MSFKNYKILITGGAGFIGSNIADKLASAGTDITILDNLSTGNIRNISSILQLPNVKFIQGSIEDSDLCNRVTFGMDVVLHHAALGSVSRSIESPLLTNAVNTTGFLNMLWAAKENKVPKFIYASSSSVYGDDTSMPKTEGKTGALLSPYAVTKMTNEKFADVFSLHYGIETIGLRYFNVFGPKQDPKGAYAAVIPLFVDACINGRPPVIFGDGNNTRDFTYVENVVDANLKAISARLKRPSSIYNIAFGSTTSLNDLFKIIARETHFNKEPEFRTERKGDIKNSWADISKAANEINYKPLIGLEEGIKRTIEWFRHNEKK